MQLSRTRWWLWALSAVYPVFGGFQLIAGAITEALTPAGTRLRDSQTLALILLIALLSLSVYFFALLRPSRFLFGSLIPVGLLVLVVVGGEAFNQTDLAALLIFVSTSVFVVVSTVCVVGRGNQPAT